MSYRFFKSPSSRVLCALISYSAGVGTTFLYNKIKGEKNKEKLFLFEPRKLQIDYDYLAPDTSEIRLLQTKRHAENLKFPNKIGTRLSNS